MRAISSRLLCALAAVLIASVSSLPAQAEPIRGAGSTFAAPVIGRWAKNYETARTDGGSYTSPDWTVDYEPVGSLAGIMRLAQPEMDFAATDAPIPPADLAQRNLAQFPIVLGGVAIVTNIDGVAAGKLRLSGPVLADIFLGRLQNWSDPAIRALNPDLTLPDLRIALLHRKDGSGTTFALTEYLSSVSPEWKAKFGADTLIAWPSGTGAEGSQGIVRAVAATKGGIAYVEFGQARRASLAFATLQNRNGQFIQPDAVGFRRAAEAADWANARDFFVKLTDLSGEGVYPIAAATFVVVPRNRAAGRIARVHDLFRLAFETGADDATALGYLPLPAPLVDQIKRSWGNAARTGG
ncbi:phosphate ABC transporter substrate-binding protein PstS [Phreatobacter stygius]|uniref:Phosphate-binding protein PstS n=1 Tax=Phreatobacter stygius TaxID=1940610 RepID=A0A4D7AZ98_9HYPH|nr:phosphate ABC transporter substrate-binding protein PstS [Phreatobacter stygius]QCI63978.1 phosphate ABC transporter substrate-binding protein PstS [Phreatobacter stygius]